MSTHPLVLVVVPALLASACSPSGKAVIPPPGTTESAPPASSRSSDEYARCEAVEPAPAEAFVFEDHAKDPLHRLRQRVVSAREALQQGRLDVAKSGYQAAIEAWRSPFSVHCADAGQEPERLKIRCTQAALLASEAFFRHAELSRQREALSAELPKYTGFQHAGSDKPMAEMSADEFQEEMRLRSRNNDELKAHIDTSVKSWVERRRAAIQAAGIEYARVREIGPFAAPCWQLAAARENARLWDSFADAFEAAPMPAWMARDAQLSGAYRSNLMEASAPLRERARAANELCSDMGRRDGLGELAASCDSWLSSHAKAGASR